MWWLAIVIRIKYVRPAGFDSTTSYTIFHAANGCAMAALCKHFYYQVCVCIRIRLVSVYKTLICRTIINSENSIQKFLFENTKLSNRKTLIFITITTKPIALWGMVWRKRRKHYLLYPFVGGENLLHQINYWRLYANSLLCQRSLDKKCWVCWVFFKKAIFYQFLGSNF